MEHLPPLMEGEGKIFTMDGASVHTASSVQDWLKEKGYTVTEWPPYSPDLNPTEHLWFPTKERVYPLTETIEEL
jgi:transposase